MAENAVFEDAGALVKRAHEIEDMMHSYVTACTGPEIDALREELIEVTSKLDEVKSKMGDKIDVKY